MRSHNVHEGAAYPVVEQWGEINDVHAGVGKKIRVAQPLEIVAEQEPVHARGVTGKNLATKTFVQKRCVVSLFPMTDRILAEALESKNGMRRRRLLYVDDSVELAGLVKTFFEMRFPVYEVLLASSVEEALQQLHAARDSGELPNAIVADANLQVRNDGATLVEAVRAEFPKIRTILVSGAPRHADQVPAHGFVLKDGNAMQFVDRMFDLVQCPTDELPCLT